MPLTDMKIRALKPTNKPQKYGDGGGLLLLVNPNGSKLWRMVYRHAGKQKQLSFGAWPEVSLAEARARRDDARKLLAEGLDPSLKKKQDKILKLEAEANTFDAIAAEFLQKNERERKSEATLSKKRWLIDLASKDIGQRPITEISVTEVLVPLRKAEGRENFETAKRMRAVISQVFRYAIITARAENDPTFGLKGALTSPKVKHRAAVTDWNSFSSLIRSVWNYSGSADTCAALKLVILLYPRPGELRMAEWSEFDLNGAVWTQDAARTKMRKEHRKPLSPIAVQILREQQKHTGKLRLVFPSIKSLERPMSENTMNQALRRMGIGRDVATSHGFRATASTLLNESGLWNADAIESELAHASKDAVRGAYHRAQYWDERVKMANWWAEQIESKLSAE